jgi:hypothetical protein
MPGVAGGCNPNSVGVKLRSSQSETPPTHTHKLSSLSFLTKKFHHLKPLGKANVESQTTTRVLLQVHPWKSERQLASYVTIRLFASLSCRQGRAGMAGSSCRALGSNKNWKGEENTRHRCLVLQTFVRSQQIVRRGWWLCGVNTAAQARDSGTERAASSSRAHSPRVTEINLCLSTSPASPIPTPESRPPKCSGTSGFTSELGRACLCHQNWDWVGQG